MNKYLKQFGVGTLMALAVCGSKVALAGERGGNGGDVLICPGNSQILDSFEANKRGWKIDLGEGDIRQKLEVSLKRLEKLDSEKAKIIRNYADEMLVDIEKYETGSGKEFKTVLFTNDILTDIDDSLEVSYPQGCRKEQLVIQREVRNEFEIPQRYIINEALWSLLDEEQKAMTITHEVLYRYSLEKNANDSRFARLLNGLIGSPLGGEPDAYMNYVKVLKAGRDYGVELIDYSEIGSRNLPLDYSKIEVNGHLIYIPFDWKKYFDSRPFKPIGFRDAKNRAGHIQLKGIVMSSLGERKYIWAFSIPGKIKFENGTIVKEGNPLSIDMSSVDVFVDNNLRVRRVVNESSVICSGDCLKEKKIYIKLKGEERKEFKTAEIDENGFIVSYE